MEILTQDLDVFARELVIDGLTGIDHRFEISEEKLRTGYERGAPLGTQEFNQLMMLITAHLPPLPCLPYVVLSTVELPSYVLECNGSTAIDQETYPNAYNMYGDTTPDLSDWAPSGWLTVIRGC